MTARRLAAIAAAAVLLIGVPLILVVMAVPRLWAGIEVAPVQSVLVDRLYDRKIPRPVLVDVRSRLAAAMPEDGESRLWLAEISAVLAGNDTAGLAKAREEALEGLRLNPSNPRGWTLLCEIDIRLRPAEAADCMDTAFYIGPFDWFVARRRSALAARLWPLLDHDTQNAAARRMRLIWDNPHMRDIVYDVDQEPTGAAMLTAAFSDDKDTLREVNRWLIHMRMWGVQRDKLGGPP